jgi:polyphosphate glucokinase
MWDDRCQGNGLGWQTRRVETSRPDAERIIADLGLAPHPEGGWYRETWRDGAGTAILFLLRSGERSAWHRVAGRAEIWHFYAGAPLTLRTAPGGTVAGPGGDVPLGWDVVLGSDVAGDQQPQYAVPAGLWQCAQTTGDWSLVGTTVAPPFDFDAFELAPPGFDPRAKSAGPSIVSRVTPLPAPDAPEGATDPAGSATDTGGHTPEGATDTGGHTPEGATDTAGSATDTPDTLAIDIGGTGLKASVLDATGEMERDRVRIDTPYPLPPDKLVHVLTDLVKPLGSYDRVSVGFPGMVRAGLVLSAPHFVSPAGPGGVPTPKLTAAWHRFELEAALAKALGKPTKVANDADLQGSAVVDGHGLELVVTLGTGVGTALFYEGRLLPHLELAHHAFRKDETYNDALGDAARKRIGTKKWNRRVAEMVEVLRALTFFDHLYIGGGNSTRVDLKLDKDVSLVDNSAGILGGIKLWHRSP